MYDYDAADRLIAVQAEAGADKNLTQYGYDDADNLLSIVENQDDTQFSVNALNQLTAANDRLYEYDANGNLLDDGLRHYQWDAENRLIQIDTQADPSATLQFQYDGLSRRVAITTNGDEQRYLWCGSEICQRRDADDTVARHYYPEGEWRQGEPLYYYRDHLGSVRDASAGNGKSLAVLDYDAYGNAIRATGETLPDFRYAGMFYLEDAGLYLTQYRGYDPVTGKWLSRDPIGELGGVNLYAYVDNNPLNFIDPFGLAKNKNKGKRPVNPNKKPPPEHRIPGGDRERNIGHPDGEEHSRRPKGGPRPRIPGSVPIILWELHQEQCRMGLIPGNIGCLPENIPPDPSMCSL